MSESRTHRHLTADEKLRLLEEAKQLGDQIG